ncbi:hypothetical protein Tco_1136063 [Tanacetum coccineum]
MFVKIMGKRKNHFARLRAEEKRRKPLTKAQKRNQMCTYLKNMAGFTHNQLKNKIFNEVQKDFDKTMSWINSFKPMDSEVVKGSKDIAKGNDDKEKYEFKQCFKIVPDDGDDVTIDATTLSVKILIVSYKIYQEGKKSFFRITRADVHCVTIQSITFYLLVKNMYPLTNHTLHQMFNDVKLQVDYECEMACDLLRLVKKQLKEGYVPE